MPLRPGIFYVLLLAACATHSESLAPEAQQAPVAEAQKQAVTAAQTAAAPPAGMPGIILAMRAVPAERSGPARAVLAELGTPGAFSPGEVYEFIVRTASGSTISVVQPAMSGLRSGEHVSILRGADTRIAARASD